MDNVDKDRPVEPTPPPTPPEAECPSEDLGRQDAPGENDLVITPDDEPGQNDMLIGADDEPLPADAPAPEPLPEEASEEPAGGEPAAEIDLEAVAATLSKQRECLVAELFGQERPRKARAQELIEAYATAAGNAAEAGLLEPDEAEAVVRSVSQSNTRALTSEQSDQGAAILEAKRHIETYDNLFVELETLVEDAAGELARLDEQDEPFQKAPEELRTTLLNFRKGIEIIHRMFARAKDRKKDLAQGLPGPLPGGWQPETPPTEPERFSEYIQQVFGNFHDLRDTNYHANQDAKKVAEKCRKAAATAVTGLLSAVDGIDAGLQNEPDTRTGLASFEAGEEGHGALIESWLGVYGRLGACVDRFLGKTGIESHTVQPGTPFDPETMEPQGTVADPEMNDEDVAAVMRRGFSLNGEPIRPILVDVVRNA